MKGLERPDQARVRVQSKTGGQDRVRPSPQSHWPASAAQLLFEAPLHAPPRTWSDQHLEIEMSGCRPTEDRDNFLGSASSWGDGPQVDRYERPLPFNDGCSAGRRGNGDFQSNAECGCSRGVPTPWWPCPNRSCALQINTLSGRFSAKIQDDDLSNRMIQADARTMPPRVPAGPPRHLGINLEGWSGKSIGDKERFSSR